MGWGAHHKHIPLGDADRVAQMQETLDRQRRMYRDHVDELVECLFRHYEINPDEETRKLLIMHLGGAFFGRTKEK